MQFALHIISNPSNPTYNITFNPNYKDLYDNKRKVIPAFGVNIAPLIYESNINIDDIKCESLLGPEDDGVHDIATWKLKNIRTDLSLPGISKLCNFTLYSLKCL